MKKKINEINMDYQTYKKLSGKLNPNDKSDITITNDKELPTSSVSASMASQMEENETIEPQDQATIKYLSNVKGPDGKVSQPFVINNKKYQMVRGLNASKEVVLCVYCHDDMHDGGDNMIHSMEYFEENIAKPMKEQMGLSGQDIQSAPEKEPSNDTYLGEYKHFVVNNSNGKVRKFKSIEELAKANMSEEESYLNLPQFKKHVSEKLFGSKNRNLREVAPTGDETDEEMNLKAKKLMDLIKKRIPTNIIDSIKTPVARREVIAAFAEMIGVPRNQLSTLIASLKDIAVTTTNIDFQQAQHGITENKKVLKTIKVKDIQ